MKAVSQYLERYAEPGTCQHTVVGKYQACLVIPAYDETMEQLLPSIKLCEQSNVLPIVVANVPSNAQNDVVDRTRMLSRNLEAHSKVLLIDRVEDPIPHKQGVGLARKIGSDIALNLIQSGHVRAGWIYQTDADAKLPNNYFTHPLPTSGAVVFSHTHTSPNATLSRAAAIYDLHMQHYINGLIFAASPYAFSTLGSTIAIHWQTYAQVRGYPRRNAGEDFYLLNKAKKVSQVVSIDAVNIELEARLSHRVPFGTGPALQRIVEHFETDPSGEQFLSYHPQVFESLAAIISELNQYASSTELKLDKWSHEVLKELGWTKVENKFKNRYSDPIQRGKAIQDWFDGLKTLRYINAAEKKFPHMPIGIAARGLHNRREHTSTDP